MTRAYKQRAVVPLDERLFAKVDASGPCWLWMGATTRGGYGLIQRGRRSGTGFVHRLVWELLVGPIPEGHDLDHLCRVRACCNPDHLQPVPRQVNVDRGARGRGVPRRTHCRLGHPFTTTDAGKRICRPCQRAANRRYRTRTNA